PGTGHDGLRLARPGLLECSRTILQPPGTDTSHTQERIKSEPRGLSPRWFGDVEHRGDKPRGSLFVAYFFSGSFKLDRNSTRSRSSRRVSFLCKSSGIAL